MALNPPGHGDDGSISSPPPSPPPLLPWPMLFLDSGTSCHMVGDPRLLCNLQDASAETRVSVGTSDGNTLPAAKIGDIQMPAEGFTIPDVLLVPGLKFDIISVRQLTKVGISTWFDADCRARLYAGSVLVGEAVAQENFAGGLYVLQFLRMKPEAERFTWSQFLPLRVHTRKQLRLPIHKQKELRLRIHHMHGDDGSISSPPPSGPKLLLDSGASMHVVSDPRLLCNIRDTPPGLNKVWAADGNTMAVTKMGDMHIEGLTIPDVRLVPGLIDDGVISVRRLAKESGICSWFVGDWAELYKGSKLVGVAVAPQDNLNGLYVLRTPKIVAA